MMLLVTESYAYENNNRRVTVKDGKGNDYIYDYDSFGCLVKERNRKGLEQNYFYDEEGQLKSENVFDGGTTGVTWSDDRTVKTVTYSATVNALFNCSSLSLISISGLIPILLIEFPFGLSQ